MSGTALGYTGSCSKPGGFMPPLPDQHALTVLALTVVALFLFTRERIPLEPSSLTVLVLLTVRPPIKQVLLLVTSFSGCDVALWVRHELAVV